MTYPISAGRACISPKGTLLFLITQDWSIFTHRIDLVRQAQKAGYQVAVMCHVNAHREALIAEGVDLYSWKSISRGGVNPFRELASLWEIYKVYKKIKPDIVYQVSLKPVLYGSLAAWCAGCGKVVNLLGGLGFLFMHHSWWVRCLRQGVLSFLKILLSRKGTYLVVQNRDDERELNSCLVPARTFLIPGSGVNLKRFRIGSRSHCPPRVIMVARLLKDKGVREFLEAARLLKKQGINGDFFCAGEIDPANPSSLTENDLAFWKTQNVVTFLGGEKDISSLLETMDIGVLPSYREGLPKVLLEYGAAGLPLVATDVPGCRDVVVPSQTGFLVPPQNSEALAQALLSLMEDKKLRQEMGNASRNRIEELYSDTIINQAFLDLFETLNRTKR